MAHVRKEEAKSKGDRLQTILRLVQEHPISRQEVLLDYLVAFTPLGLAGLFKGKKWGIFVGTVVGCLGRFVVHYISGVTIYKILAPTEFMKWTFTSPSAYSLVYNGSYMLPNTIIALVIAAVLYKPLKKYILGQDLGN